MGKIYQQLLGKKHKAHHHEGTPRDVFCRVCGESLLDDDIHEEYVCDKCNHLVSGSDSYCFFCGNELATISKARYWHKVEEFNKDKFIELIEKRGLDKGKVK
jgi:hypothetical protein